MHIVQNSYPSHVVIYIANYNYERYIHLWTMCSAFLLKSFEIFMEWLYFKIMLLCEFVDFSNHF